MAIQFTPNKLTDLDDLKAILKDLKDGLTLQNIDKFVSGLEDADDIFTQKNTILAAKNDALLLAKQGQDALDVANAKQSDIQVAQDKLEQDKSDIKSKQIELQAGLKELARAKEEVEKTKSITEAENIAVSNARKVADDLNFQLSAKAAELDAKIAEVNSKLSKLKEI